MNQIECLDSVSCVDNAGDVDFARALAYHFDVDVPVGECGEHLSGDTDHVSHLFSDQGEDGHVPVHGHLVGVKSDMVDW